MPKVSVVVPCYNAVRYVGSTLLSLQAQTLPEWECIVVDDGSTDGSADVIRADFASDKRITLLQQSNAGVCRARNAGYAASSSTSSYILFLDADDLLLPEMLAAMVSYLDEHPAVGVAYCDVACIDEHDALIDEKDPRSVAIIRYVPSRFTVRRLAAAEAETPFQSIFSIWAGLLPSNSVLRRSAYSRTPGWDEEMGQLAEDTDVFISMALRAPVHFVHQKLVRYRRHPNQSTQDRPRILAQERKLYHKWSRTSNLSPGQQNLVQAARRFRDRRVLPHVWCAHGVYHIRHGRIVDGALCFARVIRHFLGVRCEHLPSPDVRYAGAARTRAEVY